ncbi:FtsK/SpoIIIE domain-containing protein [Raineyella sp. W15-4]|uniref:FtsK/SpoIIIE domain-containing protein n=1 Tax=Raineyella sp. W15-4 TaxID=3081651 RepID=UPI002954F6B3|nr:FtsK/SpoIIIE domain-containing protein [Raineyella sp. W15-4]WOQ16721.1 FtsK/SpoIIIE domain-containing protein [Raineyella sp. W15-4]
MKTPTRNILSVPEEIAVGAARLPFFGHGNIWVEDSIENRDSVGLVQSIVQQALTRTGPGQLELVVFDDALSGLSAPFETLNSGGEKLMQTLYEQQDFKAVLKFLRDHVQGVNNVMQGREPTLVDYRSRIEYPVEGYKLVVVSTDVSLLDEDAQNQLSILLKAGPKAGVSFLVHSMTLGVNPFLVDMCQRLVIRSGQILQDTTPVVRGWSPPEPQALIDAAGDVARALADTTMDPVPFGDVQHLGQPWTGSSADGVSFAVGRYGEQTVELTLGDELNQRHNALITGAVGQGKSNLISVIIHSLCQRYSPREVELYLLDFKEGVTLQPFSGTTTGEYLPHARVLGLEADREFGLSVFRHLYALYRDRMRLFKSVGVQNIKEFREEFPREEMPRIVVIIDEFQMMFTERDRVADEIADLLIKGVRLFRACGVHLILASQTIGGNMSLMGTAGDGLFGQVPVRIALKNSLTESHATLGLNNDAAVHLRARQAIVNLDYGHLSSNRKTSIAFADEAVLGGLRRGWWRARPEGTPPPYVFEGDRRRSLAADADHLRALAANGAEIPVALLGSRVEVDGRAMEVPLSREIGRNLAVVGAGETGTGGGAILLDSAARSLAAQVPGAAFHLLDGAGQGVGLFDDLVQALRRSGCTVTYVPRGDIGEDIVGVHALLSSPEAELPHPVYVLGFSLDRCRSMPAEFQEVLRDGPVRGVHFLGWWVKYEMFRDQIGYGGETYVDTKVALRLDGQSAKQFFGDPLLEWSARDNRAVVSDTVFLDRPVSIIPYTVPCTEDPAPGNRDMVIGSEV